MGLKKSLGLVAQTGYYLKESWKPGACIPTLQKGWAQETLERFNIDLEIKGTVSLQKSTLFVGNHIGYLDIAILMAAIPGINFVAKKQLSQWPVFGSAARAMNTIFVDRGSTSSRSTAREALKNGLVSGKRVVVFPSGTTTLTESKSWRYGAFEIAEQLQVPVQPFRLTYTPLRTCAYIDNDFFPWQLYKLARTRKIKTYLEFTEPQIIRSAQNECVKWQRWTQEIMSPRFNNTRPPIPTISANLEPMP